ncbi:MAG: alkaline phosphatase [Thalassotalea sp.]|nr:alkaline phosphatase [Thalassotalea sp.]
MRKLLTAACISLAFNAQAAEKPHNIIMVIADGMGPAFTTAYRYYNDDKSTPEVETTIFDKYYVGSASTYPAPVSGYVTDSAAGATALSAGIKSYNGAIAVDVNKKPVETVLERAKQYGMKTGAVVTSQVNHATPASYIAHNESRKNYNEIADSYIDERINYQVKFDVLFGGGWEYFIRDDRNLVKELEKQGVQYIDNYEQLDTLKADKKALGLFDNIGLPHALDDTNKYRLSTMTKTATNLLENDKGYFLLIEASQVDWAGHANDISAAMGEMEDLAKTMEYLESYVAQNPNTTVILTADHSTGGLTLAAKGEYKWAPEVLTKQTQSPMSIAVTLAEQSINAGLAENLFKMAIAEEELNALKVAKEALSSDKRALVNAVKKVFDNHTNTGWTSGGHTAIDVPVIAFGEHAALFSGHQDNTEIGKKVFKLLESEKVK